MIKRTKAKCKIVMTIASHLKPISQLNLDCEKLVSEAVRGLHQLHTKLASTKIQGSDIRLNGNVTSRIK